MISLNTYIIITEALLTGWKYKASEHFDTSFLSSNGCERGKEIFPDIQYYCTEGNNLFCKAKRHLNHDPVHAY